MMLVFYTSIAISQTYTEIFENGWGRGIANSKPAVVDLDNDGLLDIIVGEWGGMLRHFEQDTPNSSDFSLVTDTFDDIDVGRYSAPCFTDLDGDGLLDMIVGNSEGDLNHYEQNAPGSVLFSSISESFNEINVGYNAAPTFTDLDNDGLLDLIIGAGDGYFHHYKQDDESSFGFSVVTDTFNHINVGDFPVPAFTDLDGDGLLDFMVGCGNNPKSKRDISTGANFTGFWRIPSHGSGSSNYSVNRGLHDRDGR